MKRLIGLVSIFLAGSSVSALAQVIPPAGLAPGSRYQLLFVTSGTIASTSTSISDYNVFVTSQAALSSALPTATWHAIVSTSNVPANQNALWVTDLPVYNTHGQQLNSGVSNLYNHSLLTPILYDQFGQQESTLVWTGSSFTGSASGPLGGGGTIGLGASNNAGLDWIHVATSTTATQLPLYALSAPITVPVPEPGAIVLAGFGGLIFSARSIRRRQQRPMFFGS